MAPEKDYFTYDDKAPVQGAESQPVIVGEGAIGGVSSDGKRQVRTIMGDAFTPKTVDGKVQVAAFDFDGTSMDGNSPVLLVLYLAKKNMLTKIDTLRIGLWALRYKFRLPQDEAWVRGMVFRAFEGRPVDEVDQFLYDFHDEVIAPRFRAAADAAMERHHLAGEVVLVVSATFEPIVRRAMEFHPIDGQMSTRMVVEGGKYTRRVLGAPVEGAEKLNAINAWCDAHYGAGNWELAYAYGDHHSDRPMLQVAKHAFAVNPDRPLSRTAKSGSWTVLEW